MKPATLAIALVAVGLAGVAGYQWGRQQTSEQHPVAAKAERKILYYRNAMGLPDTSPVPKQDSMGMDYVPVYEGEEASGPTVAVSAERLQLLGVKAESAQLRKLVRTIRASATVQASERSLYLISPRFEGWVQQLHVNATGQRVTRGQPLLTVYSPELQSAAREYQLASESGLKDLAQSTRQRMQNWGIAEEDLQHLAHGAANLVLRSPISGVVLEKNAVAGARFAPGEVLFKLADLSSVWVQAEVSEQDQAMLRAGMRARVVVDAYPGEIFSGRINFISPVLNPQTRTTQVRVELPNRDGRLRPAMFAQVELAAGEHAVPVLSIPVSAVIDSGTRQLALVQVAAGRFAPRELKLGRRTAEYIEVLEGIGEGEMVVTRANFLLDAESNLKAALGSASHQNGAAMPEEPEPTAERQRNGQEAPPAMKMEHHHAG